VDYGGGPAYRATAVAYPNYLDELRPSDMWWTISCKPNQYFRFIWA